MGCGCGHYLRSLNKIIKSNLYYTGLDSQKDFIKECLEKDLTKAEKDHLTGAFDKYSQSSCINVKLPNNIFAYCPLLIL